MAKTGICWKFDCGQIFAMLSKSPFDHPTPACVFQRNWSGIETNQFLPTPPLHDIFMGYIPLGYIFVGETGT